jgi:tripartite ATP-independent transporter DctP family solute receptor
MKRKLSMILVLPILFSLAFVAPSGAEQKVFSLNHTMGVNNFPDQAVKWFAQQLEQRSKGGMKVKVFSAGELGQEVEQYDAMNLGNLESALMGAQIIGAVCPEYGTLDLPYLWRDTEHVRKVLGGPIGQEMNQVILQRKGIRILALMNRGPRNLTTKNKIIKIPADLKGLRLRTIQNPVHIEAWRTLGANPVPMAWGEVFTALQQGTIDAQESPYEAIDANSIFEVQKYLIVTRHVHAPIWFGASEKFWKTLNPEQQKLLADTAIDAAAYNDKLLLDGELSLEKKLQAKGMILVKPELEKFMDGVKTVPEKFKNVWKPGLYENITRTK